MKRAAIVDTHPEGGDALAAPFMSGAVPQSGNRPIAALFTTTEQYMRTRFSDLYTFTAQLREERGE